MYFFCKKERKKNLGLEWSEESTSSTFLVRNGIS